jgi:hypothetical protein
MIPTIASYQLAAKRCSSQHHVSKSLLILPIIMCALTCVSCTEDAASPLVDVTPLGDGFGKGVRILNKVEASGLIDELLDTYGAGQRERRSGSAYNSNRGNRNERNAA